MTVKHQPATPLPWYPAYGLTTGAVHSKPLNEQTNDTRLSAKNLKRADAAYMFHAANAYPKLVETLRDLRAQAAGVAGCADPECGVCQSNKKRIARADALLLELGESNAAPLDGLTAASASTYARRHTLNRVEALLRIVGQVLSVPQVGITLDTKIAEADSLDRVEICMAVEDEFEIEIQDADAEKFSTVGDILNYVNAAVPA